MSGLLTAYVLAGAMPWGVVYAFLLWRDPYFIAALSVLLAVYTQLQPDPVALSRAVLSEFSNYVPVARLCALAICFWYVHTLWREIDGKRRALLLREYVREGRHRSMFKGDNRAIARRDRFLKRQRKLRGGKESRKNRL